MCNGERQSFFSKVNNETGGLFLPLVFNIVVTFKLGQLGKNKKRHPNWKGRGKIICLHMTLPYM